MPLAAVPATAKSAKNVVAARFHRSLTRIVAEPDGECIALAAKRTIRSLLHGGLLNRAVATLRILGLAMGANATCIGCRCG